MIELVSVQDVESYESDREIALFQEYRDVISLFRYVVETERRFYLANKVEVHPYTSQGEVFFEVTLEDAWVWDIYRSSRFVSHVRVISYKDINIEEISHSELNIPGAS